VHASTNLYAQAAAFWYLLVLRDIATAMMAMPWKS
jgi:hypothetical protein